MDTIKMLGTFLSDLKNKEQQEFISDIIGVYFF